MAYAYAQKNAVVSWRSKIVTVHCHEVWAADDPFVEGHPGLFGDTPTKVHRTVAKPAPAPDRVEQATAAPGEKRSTRRRSSGSKK